MKEATPNLRSVEMYTGCVKKTVPLSPLIENIHIKRIEAGRTCNEDRRLRPSTERN